MAIVVSGRRNLSSHDDQGNNPAWEMSLFLDEDYNTNYRFCILNFKYEIKYPKIKRYLLLC